MADIIYSTKMQSLSEIRDRDFDFSKDLQSGVTIEGIHSVEHIPPSGAASTPIVGAISGGIVPVRVGPLTVTGQHTLIVEVELSNDEISSIKLFFPVEY
jgi:hypothetical protein